MLEEGIVRASLWRGAEEIASGKTRRHREQEGAVAAAEIDFERRGSRENVGQFRAADMIGGLPHRPLGPRQKCGVLFRGHDCFGRKKATAVAP